MGFIVDQRGNEIDRLKIKAIIEMPALRMERKVRGFLGLPKYIRCFIVRLTI